MELRPGRVGAINGAAARRLSLACGAAALVIGGLVLTGWGFDVPRLKSVLPWTASMKPDSALAAVLAGLAVILLHAPIAGRVVRRRAAAGLAAGVGIIGALALAEYVLGVRVDVGERLGIGAAAPGRMAVASALAFMICSVALILLLARTTLAAQLLAGLILVFAFGDVLSFIYGVAVARPSGTTQVAVQSVAVFIAIGLALLLACPEEGVVGALLPDEPGSVMARSLLLAAVVSLPVLGGLRLAGEQAGLYSARKGVGIMVIVSMLVVVAAAWATARRLNRLGRQRSSAIDRLAASERRLHRTLEQLLHVRENERRGLAMDLHDDVLPALAAVTLQLELAQGRCWDREGGERVARAERELRSARLRLRHLMFDLVPEALAQEGLGGALRHRLQQMHDLTGVAVELDDRIGRTPATETAAILYRIALEALRNVSRHAQASHVRVTIEQADGHVGVTVVDDGVGIAATDGHPGHMGLTMMAQRARLVGGDVEIRSEPAHGTTVACRVPALIDERFRGG